MICPFCAQSNPEASRRRCCFCDNLLEAAEDRTASGGATAAHQGLAGPAPVAPTRLAAGEDPQLARHGRALDRARLFWTIVVAVAAAVWLLFKWKLRC